MGQPKRGGSWNEGSAVTCRRQEKGGLVVCQVAAAAAAAEEKEEEASTAAVAAGKENENAKNARNPEGSLTATSFQWSLSLSFFPSQKIRFRIGISELKPASTRSLAFHTTLRREATENVSAQRQNDRKTHTDRPPRMGAGGKHDRALKFSSANNGNHKSAQTQGIKYVAEKNERREGKVEVAKGRVSSRQRVEERTADALVDRE